MQHADPNEKQFSFSGDPEIDAQFEALVSENELMLIDITQLKAKNKQLETTIASLEEKIASQAEELRNWHDYSTSNAAQHDGDIQEMQAKHDALMEEHEDLLSRYELLQDTVNRDIQENEEAQPLRDLEAKAQSRVERLLRELKLFSNSQTQVCSSLKRSGIAPATIQSSIRPEAEKNIATLRKVSESSNRLTQTGGHDDDEIVTLVKNLVGTVLVSACSALTDTLAKMLELIPAAPSTPAGGTDSGSSAGGLRSIQFWQKK